MDMSEPGKEENIRTFLGIGLSASIKEAYTEMIKPFLDLDVRVSWVKPENLHITLSFLGPTPSGQLPLIGSAMDEVTAGFQPFELLLEGIGTFGPAANPRVLWLGVGGETRELTHIQSQLAGQLEALGFPPEKRTFSPHVTIGRVKGNKGLDALTSAILSAKNIVLGRARVQSVQLYESILTPKGSIYKIQHTTTLKGV